MKKTGFYLLLCLLCISGVQAQDIEYGDNVEKRNVGSFTGIDAAAGIQVIITKGDREELAVTANNKEYLGEVRTVVQGGVLKIYRSDDWKFWRQWKNWRIKVYVSYTRLETLKATSGASITGKEISLDKLVAKLNSGGSIRLAGAVQNLEVDGSSGAQFQCYELNTNICRAEVSSGAGIQVSVAREISARATSGGYIRYKGEGLIRDINVNSGGSVRKQAGN